MGDGPGQNKYRFSDTPPWSPHRRPSWPETGTWLDTQEGPSISGEDAPGEEVGLKENFLFLHQPSVRTADLTGLT